MKKFFAMAAAAMIAAMSAHAQYWTEVDTKEALNSAIADGAYIRLTGDITLSAYLQIGNGVNQTVTIDLNGHRLSRNLNAADRNGHVIEVFSKGTLTIQDGSANRTGKLTGGWAVNGGGICNYGTLYFKGGTITHCKASERGGGIMNAGKLTVTDGFIEDNNSGVEGGGLYLKAGSTATLQSAIIRYNISADGGGFYVDQSAKANLTNSVMMSNISTLHGGGGITNHGTLSIDVAVITNNTCLTYGGGIWSGGTLNMKGFIIVKDNKSTNGTSTNVFLLSGNVINVTGDISSSIIGICKDGYAGAVTHDLLNLGNLSNFTNDCADIADMGLNSSGEIAFTPKSDRVYYIERSWDSSNKRVIETAKTVTNYTELTGMGDGYGNDLQLANGGWYVVKRTGAKYNRLLAPSGAPAHIIVCDGASLEGCLRIDKGESIKIYGQSANTGTITARSPKTVEDLATRYGTPIGAGSEAMGKLEVHGGTIVSVSDNGPGIGGWGDGADNGTFTMYGGTVTATGAKKAAGIGGGYSCDGITVNIYGGTVTATGNFGGAGIGSGSSKESATPNGGLISIYGGTVFAYGSGPDWSESSQSGAGIGGGGDGYGGTITISGGHVEAHGGDDAAGIGSGEEGWASNNIDGGTITITGGYIEAWGNDEGAGIGGGERAASGNITIAGGTIVAHGGENSMAICGHDDSDGLRSITLGNEMMVTAERTFTAPERLDAITYRRDVVVQPCTHSDATCTVTGSTHTHKCSYCLHNVSEPHIYVDGVCTVCGKESYWTDEGNYSTTFREGDHIIYIDSEADLARMAYNINNGVTEYIGWTFVVTRDLDMSAHLWMPIGTEQRPVMASFDGQGHTISGIHVNRPNAINNGLFGYVDCPQIRDFVLKSSTIIGGDYTGGVIGSVYGKKGKCIIDQVMCYATVKGNNWAGGLVGVYTLARMIENTTNCLYLGNSVTGSEYVGAICSNWVNSSYFSNTYYTVAAPYANACEIRAYALKPDANPEGVVISISGDNGIAFDGNYYAPNGATVNIKAVYHNGLNKVVDGLAVNGQQLDANADGTYSYTIHADASVQEYLVTATLADTGITGDGTEANPYIIASTNQWDIFARSVSLGVSFSGKHVKLASDIAVTTRVGADGHPFSGTFDGNGHKLTIDYHSDAECCAPFRFVNGATIKNLRIDGTITSRHYYTGSIIGRAEGNVRLLACHSSVTIELEYTELPYNSSMVGIVTNAITIEGCVFDGKLFQLDENARVSGGFVGYRAGLVPVSIKDCIFAPTEMYVRGYETFVYTKNYNPENITITNSYHTSQIGGEQGTRGFKHAQPPTDLGATLQTYGASGITAYENGLAYDGYYYNSYPDVLLTDLADNSAILAQAAGKMVSVSISNRTLRAIENGIGWESRAYTVCLPFDLDIYKQTGNNRYVQYYTLYSVDNHYRELIFHEARYENVDDISEAPNILYAGHPYVVVVNYGELRLEANDVTIAATPVDIPVVRELDLGEVYDVGETPEVIGQWRGTFHNISNDDAAAMKAHTMSNDGCFRRISNAPGYQGAYIGTFRAFFSPYESDGYYAYDPMYVSHTEGEDDEFGIQDFPADGFEGDNDYTDETTGIGTIHTIDRDGTHRYYDMQGRQLRQRPAKGLYIEKGKIKFNK